MGKKGNYVSISSICIFYGIFVGSVATSMEAEAQENEISMVEAFRDSIDTRLGRFFYLPVWIYAKAIDSYEMKRASE